MHTTSRLVAVLLLCTMASAMPGLRAFARSATPTHPVGCHGHAPAPLSYECCVNGHHAAMPNLAFSTRPPLAQAASLEPDQKILQASDFFRHCTVSVVPSYSPPDAAPLRI